jgi:protein TonB
MRFAPLLRRRASAAAATIVLVGACCAAHAQFQSVPLPAAAPAAESGAATPLEYRRDAARHVYAVFPKRIHRGKMPPLLYGVAIVDTEVDAEGRVIDVRIRRPPAAPEVGPWIVSMIRRASPFPVPARLGAPLTFSEIWLVDKGGSFQLDTLTEGQR